MIELTDWEVSTLVECLTSELHESDVVWAEEHGKPLSSRQRMELELMRKLRGLDDGGLRLAIVPAGMAEAPEAMARAANNATVSRELAKPAPARRLAQLQLV